MRPLMVTALLVWSVLAVAREAPPPVLPSPAPAPAGSTNSVRPREAPHVAASDVGRFRAEWPSGCARLYTRVKKNDAGEPLVVDVTCRRSGQDDRGCKVTVLKDFTPARPPTPAIVARNIERMIRELGLAVDHQAQINRHGHDGIAVFCHEKGGRRTLWVEGYVVGLQALLVEAWDVDDRLLDDPEIKTFFDSVVLLEE